VSDVLISSAQRQSTVQNGGIASSSLFTVILDNSLFGRYQLKQIQIPNTAYNVFAVNGSSAGNNIIYFSDSGGAHTYTVPPGYYTNTTLLSTLQSGMNGAVGSIGTYVVTQGANNNLVTISAGANFTLTFGTNTVNSISAVIGFTNVNTSGSASTYTGTYPLNLRTIQNLFIVVTNSSGQIYKNVFGANQKQYTFIVPVLVNTSDIIFFSEDFFRQQFVVGSPENIITVSVVDVNGNSLNIQNVDWNFILSPILDNSSVLTGQSSSSIVVPNQNNTTVVPSSHVVLDHKGVIPNTIYPSSDILRF